MDGILNVYKEKGFTSHDVVAIIRKVLNTKKVGHTGTLDPDAQGVLPICVGKATKLSDMIMDGKKTYEAVLKLGVTTTTEDALGEVLEERDVTVSREQIAEVIASFVGELEQIPPMYSAVKVNGKKLYELAREGKVIERKTRNITIYGIEILDFLSPERIEIRIDCSKGTYIRTLCADIGKVLGCGGHMESLIRTRTGSFSLEKAYKLDEIRDFAKENRIAEMMLPMKEALHHFPAIVVDERAEKLLYNGGRVKQNYWCECTIEPVIAAKVVVFDAKNQLVGLYEIDKDEAFFIKPFKMLI